jgi:flagellar biosynthesis protein FlhF
VFKPSKLLFTRLDETDTLGPAVSLSVRMGIPISFLSRGQRIPEDLEVATVDLMLNSILQGEAAEEPSFGAAAA